MKGGRRQLHNSNHTLKHAQTKEELKHEITVASQYNYPSNNDIHKTNLEYFLHKMAGNEVNYLQSNIHRHGKKTPDKGEKVMVTCYFKQCPA